MINLLVLGVLALATYRATQLVVHDTIGDPVRDYVIHWQQRRPDSAVRHAAVTLMSCVYCAGWWLAGLILAVYLLAAGQWSAAPVLVHGLEWLAVAGGGVLLNRWDDSRSGAGA
ncbi:DUF1360 domain-containing protein [Kitasatospora phosalacinea]|uniref:DUF1360 domain-containing protein n=1 Tax=Kitasatospora phosalacinea TaxID=2065 RepID=UPI0035E07A1F